MPHERRRDRVRRRASLASLLAACRPFVRPRSHAGRSTPCYEEHGDARRGDRCTAAPPAGSLPAWRSSALATVLAVALVPRTTIVGVTALAIALLLVMPAAFARHDAAARPARRGERAATCCSWRVMGARSAMTRSIAVAAIASLAVFGSVAIGGARDDLVHGLAHGFADHVGTADVWITTTGRASRPTLPAHAAELTRLRSAPGIVAVRRLPRRHVDLPRPPRLAHRAAAGGSRDRPVDAAARRRSARPPSSACTRAAGSTVSQHDRRRHASRVGAPLHAADADRDAAPAARRHRRRTSAGAPGAIVLNTRDYRRGWASTDAERDRGRPRPRRHACRRQARSCGAHSTPDVRWTSRPPRQLDDEFDVRSSTAG